MTQENLSREITETEIKKVLRDEKLSPSQVSDAYTERYEFVGVRRIRKRLKELAKNGTLEEETMNDAQDLMYCLKE